MAAAPESRLDWFQNPTVNKGLGAGLATIALAGVGAGIGIEVVICMLPLLSRVATLDLVAPPVAMTGSASATHRSREPR